MYPVIHGNCNRRFVHPYSYLFYNFVLVCLLLAACGGPPPLKVTGRTSGEVPFIRVGIQMNQQAVYVAGTGPLQVIDRPTGTVVGESGRAEVWQLDPAGAKIEAFAPDGVSRGRYTGPVLVRPVRTGSRIWVSGREYRGLIEVRLDTKGTLTVVNEVDVENYLRGVVPAEIGKLDEEKIDAARAQAVAARTYALAHRGRRQSLGFDVFASIEDQVYRGYGTEAPVVDRAIAETRGIVASYQGKMIETYYSSTCGGHTESIAEGWKTDPVPYLRNVKDKGRGRGDFCSASPWYRWTETWDREALEGILTASMAVFTGRKEEDLKLKDIRIRKRSKSGRVSVLEIRTAQGVTRFEGDKVRSVLRRTAEGTPPLRSTLFSLNIQRDWRGRPDIVVAKGSGYGHGIGMCQMGAIVMASRGYRFDQILRHYYRDIDLKRIY
ncbi:MAG: SpoIID/LytB domain-containing protein [candidate division Zixibacteria bacterium]|nr:SpoIID/LytB domain-containing protein [candidate division Zixibacteria bacterium]